MKFKNNASSKLATSLTAEATTLKVIADTGSNFPSIVSPKEYFHATLVGDNGDMEIIRVTNISGDTFTVVRAQEDTVAKEWPAGTRLENRITAEFLNQVATGDTIKFDQVTIKTDSEGVSSVDPAEVYPPASSTELGVVKVDEETITISEDNAISVLPSGIIDNNTIVLDENGKLTSKSIPFDKPSDNRWHQSHFSFSAVANTAVPVNATNLVNYDTSANNSVLFEPNSSGQLICRKTGLYGVRVEFSPYYAGDGSTEAMDGWFYIKLDNIDIGSSGTPLLAAANEPNVFTCYVNRRIEAGQIISTAWNIPYTGNVSINYIDYQFTYFPVTNEYQVSNSELNIYYNGESAEVPVANAGNAIFSPGDLVERTDSFTRKFSSKNNLGYVQINESGLYYISHILTINPFDTAVDLVCGVSSVTENGDYKLPYTKSTLHLDPMSIATDVNSTSTVRYVEAGEIFAFYIQDGGTVTGNYTITNSSMSFAKFPSLVDASNILPFTPPTADAPGKEGLVPQPQATAPSTQLANVLTMQGWGSFSSAFAQASPFNSKELVPSIQVVASSADLNSIPPGTYYCSKWTNVPDGAVAGGRSWVWFSRENGGGYGYSQIYIDDVGNPWIRGSLTATFDGELPVWNVWVGIGAPRPKSAAGVGQWVSLGTAPGTGASITLPAGGVWAYFLTGASALGDINGTKAGVAGGSTVVTITDVTVPVSFVWGFCYRVA